MNADIHADAAFQALQFDRSMVQSQSTIHLCRIGLYQVSAGREGQKRADGFVRVLTLVVRCIAAISPNVGPQLFRPFARAARHHSKT
jgi:hypothetical protein